MIRCRNCLDHGLTRGLIYVGNEDKTLFNTGYLHAENMQWWCFPSCTAEPVEGDIE